MMATVPTLAHGRLGRLGRRRQHRRPLPSRRMKAPSLARAAPPASRMEHLQNHNPPPTTPPNPPLPTPPLHLPAPAPLFPRAGWSACAMALLAVCALAPVLNLWLPAGSLLHLSDYTVALLGKIMCYAICALAMDLIWGYTGILSLGHGLFFALGGYVMGMYLMRQIGRDGNYQSALPDFMVFLDWKALPW